MLTWQLGREDEEAETEPQNLFIYLFGFCGEGGGGDESRN